MNTFKKWGYSFLTKMPGGKGIRDKLHSEAILFQPITPHLYKGLEKVKGGADAMHIPAYQKIFLLLSAFYFNGLRGDVLEFGSFSGYSAQLFAKGIKRFRLKQSRLHLFDSFEGLPSFSKGDLQTYESVNGVWNQGGMSLPPRFDQLLQKKLEKILDKDRVHVVKGFFEKTMEKHIEQSQVKKALLVHLDCDLYSSSQSVLRTLMKKQIFQDGTILICDDWMTNFGNPNLGQRLAVKEILEEYPQWKFEEYFNYGMGSQVFLAHDLSISQGKKWK